MSDRAKELAGQIEEVAAEVVATVEGLSDDQWKAVTSAERWPVAIVACHLADLHDIFGKVIDDLMKDPEKRVNLTTEQIDEINAQRAIARADVTRAEIVGRLRTSSPPLAAKVAALNDDQLEWQIGNFSGYEMAIGSFAEFGIVGHFREHLASIRATIGE